MEFIRKARTVLLYEKAIKTDIYAVSFALITVFSFKVLLGNVSLVEKTNFKHFQMLNTRNVTKTLNQQKSRP
jgi:hypothetical protein